MPNDDPYERAQVHTVHPRPKEVVVALCCAGLAVASVAACRTARASAREDRVQPTASADGASARRAPRAVAESAGHALAEPSGRAVVDLSVGRPSVVVTPDAGAYVVVAAGPATFGSRGGWYVAYVAAGDRGGVDAPGSAERLVLAADALFKSQQVVAELAGAELFSVFALYGAPGSPGAVRELTYLPGSQGWSRSAESLVGEVSSMPPLPETFDRDPAGESAAIAVARQFLAHGDRGELEAAWRLSSTAMKETTGRASFDQQLRAAAHPDVTGPRREVFHSFGMTPFTAGTELEVLFERAGSFEAVQVRMDDDLQWRVLRVRGFAVEAPRRTGAAVGEVEL